MKKGVSLISLIITIIVIIILASIAIYSSYSTADEAYEVKYGKEFNDVATFVNTVNAKSEARLITLSLTSDTVATSAQIDSFFTTGTDTEITSDDIAKIKYKNSGTDYKYQYHYITANQIESGVPGVPIDSNLDELENDYLINFGYGVVIAKITDTKTKVSGAVK